MSDPRLFRMAGNGSSDDPETCLGARVGGVHAAIGAGSKIDNPPEIGHKGQIGCGCALGEYSTVDRAAQIAAQSGMSATWRRG